jgi:mannose-6-phosphate isomerase-like protein (cupin superfamily)
MDVINLKEKLKLFSDHWSPKIIGQLNGQYVKLAKIKGEFVWHNHAHEDELFFVIKGELTIEFKDGARHLSPGDMIIIPAGVDHRPIAEEEVEIMLFEPISTKHTGAVIHDLTQEKEQFI